MVIVDKRKRNWNICNARKSKAGSNFRPFRRRSQRAYGRILEEAKTQAQSYINDIMDDAKLTASKEANVSLYSPSNV